MSEVIKLLNQHFNYSISFKRSFFSIKVLSIGLMWLFTCSALIGIGLGYMEWFIPKTPINLLLGFLLLIINVPFGTRKGLWLFCVSFIVGMSIEIAGVSTGKIFGIYEYGSNLGFKAWGVPIMIGIYWAVLVVVTSQMARFYFKNTVLVAVSGALMMVGLDFLMEQMAAMFDFWHFSGGIAGIQNYIAWFLVAFLLHLLALRWLPRGGELFSTHLYINQIVFFGVSYLLLFIL